MHDVALESAGEPRVLNRGGTQSLVHGGGESQLQPTAYRSCSPQSRSVGSTTSSSRSTRRHQDKIKLQLAQFALKQKQDEQREAEQRSKYEVELKLRKAQIEAQIEAEEARMKSEITTKEAQREVEIAQLEEELWEMLSVGAGETHTKGFLQKDACVFPSTSSRPACATVNTTAIPICLLVVIHGHIIPHTLYQ